MQLIVNITVLAAIYALLACGYVLIYRVSRVMNMALIAFPNVRRLVYLRQRFVR